MKKLTLYIIALINLCFSLNIEHSEIYDNSWALIVGINKYEKVRPLNYAIEDASAIKNMLINDFGFPRSNVNILINSEATQNNIKKQLNALVKSAKDNDRVLFYFAGHGQTETSGLEGKDMGFLLPVEADEENLYLTAIPMDELKRIATMSKAKHMMFLVDACYGGLAAQNTRSLQPKDTPNFIDKISNNYSRQIITAGGKSEEVLEKDDWEHSAFTKNLLSGLKGKRADLNSDRIITGSEIGMYLIENVSLDTDNFQTPQFGRYSSHDGDIIFVLEEETPNKNESKSLTVEEQLQAMLLLYQQNQVQQNPIQAKTNAVVIKPGSIGINAKNLTQEIYIEEIFLRPRGLAYKVKYKMEIGYDDEVNWSRIFVINVDDVLEIPGETITGIYNYNTGEVE